MTPSPTPPDTATPNRRPLAVLVWLWVGLPFAYGLWELALKIAPLFSD